MSIDKKIKSVESEINRLKEQQKQENAMAEVLPLRFADNMAAFGEYIPRFMSNSKTIALSVPSVFFVMRMEYLIYFGWMIMFPYMALTHINRLRSR